ncbi:MAG: hypothetical protein WA125_17110 [Desulfosporosinus sp.]
MGAKGINFAEELHVVNIIPPFGSDAATKNSDVFTLKGHAHATIILTVGTQGGSFTAKLYECDNFTPSTATAIATRVYKEETALGDTLGAAVAVTAADGVATAVANNIMYVFEVNADELTEGYPCLQLRLSDLDNTTYVSAVAILSGSRYASDQSASAIA